MKKGLVLCEKPSHVKKMKELLKNPVSRGRAVVGEYNGYELTLFPLAGHILEIPTPDKIDDKFKGSFAEAIKYLPIMPPENDFYKRTPSEKTLNIYNSFKQFVFGVDFVLIATDPDYEGKALAKEALLKTKTYNKVLADIRMENLSKNVLKKELDKALNGKSDLDYDTMANIGLLRGDLNYGIGINLSRYLIGTMQKKASFGTAQTRIVDLVVKRTVEYVKFNKRKFWTLKLQTDIGEFVVELDEDVKFDKEKVYEIAQKIDEKYLTVIDVKKQKKEEKPLKWYDGSDLAEEAAKILKTTPFALLDEKKGLLEQMYLNGIMTYPRTDSKNMMPISQFEEQGEIAQFYAKYYNADPDVSLQKKGLWYPDEKALELKINHTPFTVAKPGIDIEKLSKDEKVIFDLAVKRLLSVFYPNPVTLNITVTGDIEGVKAVLKETSDVAMGYKEIYGEKKRESKLDNMDLEGKSFKVNDVVITEDVTKPKPLYTTSSIIKEMKRKNIGTEGTYKALFEKVTDPQRPYITLQKNKLIATEFAIEFIQMIPDEAVYVINEFEEEILKKLESKKISLKEAFRKRNEIILKVFNIVKGVIDSNVDNLTNKLQNADNVGKCPLCGGNVISKKSGFVCENRKVTKENGKWVNKGSCDFFIPYKVDTDKVSYKITQSTLKKLLAGKKTQVEVFYKNANKKVKTQIFYDTDQKRIMFEFKNK